MPWTELISRRTQTAKHFYDTANPQRRTFQQVLKTPIHYRPEQDAPMEPVDLMPQRVNNAALNGWRVTRAGWHYALGVPGDGPLAGMDGVVGFGGRQGAHWVKFRLQRAGYLHWPTRTWEDIGGQPTYDRANLSRSAHSVTVGPNEQTITVANVANWANIWPGVDVRWRVDGLALKEEIYLSQNTRENMPSPSTPANETYFCFAFRLDISDVPKWVKNGVEQSPDGDFEATDSPIQLKDAQDRLLAFMPIDYAIADDGETRVKLRKRIYRQGDNYWLVIGAPVLELAGLPAGGITFDPTFSDQPDEATAADTYLHAGQPTSNRDGRPELITWAGNRHILIDWDLSSIPNDATCDAATLSLWSQDSDATAEYDIYRMLQAWVENLADWNTYDGSTPWPGSSGASTPGIDYDGTVLGTIVYPTNAIDTEAQASLLTAEVEPYFGDTLHLSIGQTAPVNGFRDWHSSSATNAALRPKINIDYTEASPPPAGAGPGVTIKSRGDTEANWINVNPVLAEREIGLETDTLRFKVGDGATAWVGLAYWEMTGPAGADGDTPYIQGGTWWIGDTDTGVQTTGPQGPAGADGADGADGLLKQIVVSEKTGQSSYSGTAWSIFHTGSITIQQGSGILALLSAHIYDATNGGPNYGVRLTRDGLDIKDIGQSFLENVNRSVLNKAGMAYWPNLNSGNYVIRAEWAVYNGHTIYSLDDQNNRPCRLILLEV